MLTCALSRSGIKKAPKQRYSSTKGVRAKAGQPRCEPPRLICLHLLTVPPPQMEPKFLRNAKFARKHNAKGRSTEA